MKTKVKLFRMNYDGKDEQFRINIITIIYKYLFFIACGFITKIF